MKTTVKHQLITELNEARTTLTHLIDKTSEELKVEKKLNALLIQVVDLPVV